MAVKSFPPPPESLRTDPQTLQWFTQLVQTVVNQGATATETSAGLVLTAGAVTDAIASSVAVTTPDAPAQSGVYVQTDVQEIADLANEIKGDVNTLVSDVNDLKDVINALTASLRAAGLLAP